MRFKYYLRGLGLGILTTTIIFMISIRIHGGIMTDDRAIERAKELGMIIPEEDATETESEEEISPAPSVEVIDQMEDSDDAIGEEEANGSLIDESIDVTLDASTENIEGNIGDQAETTDEGSMEIIVIHLTDDDVCRTAGEKLLSAGLIDDVESFRDYMSDIGYAGLIRGGDFEIPSDAELELIAKIITGQNE